MWVGWGGPIYGGGSSKALLYLHCALLAQLFIQPVSQYQFLCAEADQPPLGMRLSAQAFNALPAASLRVLSGVDRNSTQIVTLYVGIIDILQSYDFKKKAESLIKGLRHHRAAISATDPASYAERFENFIHNIISLC